MGEQLIANYDGRFLRIKIPLPPLKVYCGFLFKPSETINELRTKISTEITINCTIVVEDVDGVKFALSTCVKSLIPTGFYLKLDEDRYCIEILSTVGKDPSDNNQGNSLDRIDVDDFCAKKREADQPTAGF